MRGISFWFESVVPLIIHSSHQPIFKILVAKFISRATVPTFKQTAISHIQFMSACQSTAGVQPSDHETNVLNTTLQERQSNKKFRLSVCKSMQLSIQSVQAIQPIDQKKFIINQSIDWMLIG